VDDRDSPPSDSTGPRDSKRILRTLQEGKRLEAYVERQSDEMRVCALCEKVYYRRKPMKKIGARWYCIDCLRSLKESLDSLDRWEELSLLNEQIESRVSGTAKRG
jgi:hypothetical protein